MSSETRSINRIIEEWQAGIDRQENFRRLFERYYRPVYHFFAKRGFSAESCQDLTQETFIRVYIGMAGFRRESRFETWLFQIAGNTYRKELRRQSASKRAGQQVSLEGASEKGSSASGGSELGDPSSTQGPLDDVLHTEQRQELRRAIEELPEQMRKCLMLRVYQELSYREIAVVLRLSAETVKAHLHQARQRLRDELAGYFDSGEIVI